MDSFFKPLKGPRALKPWFEITRATPVELQRMFDRFRSRHRKLAKVEKLLREVRALPEDQRHPLAVDNLTARRNNALAHLTFSEQNLRNHLKFAVARYDGTLDEIKPLANGKMRPGRAQKNLADARATVRYYNAAIDEFCLAAAAAAGSWKRTVCGGGKPCAEYRSGKTLMKKGNKQIVACKHVIADHARKPIAGHTGSEEAAVALIEHAKPVIDVMKRKSGREDDVAEQLAWIEVIETAAKFDLANGKHARFNTFYTWWARRATQVRSANDCPPGKTRIKGKIIARGTLHVEEGEGDSARYHPTVTDEDNSAKEAVLLALSKLSEEEQEIATLTLMGDVSLRNLAEQKGCTVHHIRKLKAEVTEKLQAILKDFAEC